MVGVFRLLVVVDGAEDFFGGEEEGGHFPDGHFKVHLGKFEDSVHGILATSSSNTVCSSLVRLERQDFRVRENTQPFEESGHSETFRSSARIRGSSEVWRTSMLPG